MLTWTIAIQLIRPGRRRPENVFLAAFLGLIGAGFAVEVWSTVLRQRGAPLDLDVFALQLVFNIPDPVVLLYFATLYPIRSRLNHPAIFLALGAAVCLILWRAVTSPTDFLWDRNAFSVDGTASVTNFPAFRFAYDLLIISCYSLALILLVRNAYARPDALTRIAIAAFFVALVPRISMTIVDLLDPFSLTSDAVFGPLHPGSPAEKIRTAAIHLGISVPVVLGFAAVGKRLSPRRVTHQAIRIGALGALLLVVVSPIASLIEASGLAPAQQFGPVGSAMSAARWIVFSILVGYVLLERDVFDIQKRAHASLVGTILLAGVGGALVAALALAQAVMGEPASGVLTAVGLVTGVAAGAFVLPFANSAADRILPHAKDARYLNDRRLDVFHAAVAEAVASGRDPRHDERLSDLRETLGIPDESLASIASAVQGTPMLVPGAVLWGRYRLEALLGSGGSGRTWRARDLLADSEVAVKQVFGVAGGAGSEAHARELTVARRIAHPRIVRLLESRALGLDTFLVLEFMPLGSLADRLAAEGAMRPAEGARLLREVLDALEAAHANRVIHRDVKPANILLDALGGARLSDFGAAKLGKLDATAVGAAGLVHATPRYAAPEVLLGARATPASDLYSVGVVAVEVFGGKVATPPVLAHVDGLPVSASMRSILRRALDTDPGRRYASAREFAAAIGGAPEWTGPRRGDVT